MNTTLSARFRSAIVSGNIESVRAQIDDGAAVNAFNAQKETPLHIAVEKNNEDIVRLLLEKGAQPLPDSSNFEPLHIACFQQSLSIVRLLLNARTELKVLTRQPLLIALLIATQKGNQQLVSLLLSAGVEPNVYLQSPFCHHRLPFSVSFGSFPLHLACQQGHLGIVKRLLEYKANSNCSRYTDNYKPIHLAAENDHVEVAEYLLSSGVDPNVEASNKLTPLHLAAKAGCAKVIKVLLNNSANVHCQADIGLTPLILAVKHGQEEVIKILLEHGACVNDTDKNNNEPLWYAVEKRNLILVNCILPYKPEISLKVNESICNIILHDKSHSAVVDALIDYGLAVKPEDMNDFLLPAVKKGYPKIVECLLENGADPNDKSYNSALLHHAVESGNHETIKLLLKAGCNVNAKDKSGKTAIHYLLRHDKNSTHVETIQLLLSNGASIENASELLHEAVKQGSIELCQFLIQMGVDVNERDPKGRVPLHHTAPYKQSDYGYYRRYETSSEEEDDGEIRGKIARLLLENGADVDAATKRGSTTLQLAVESKWSEVVRVLLEFKANVNIMDEDHFVPLHIAAKNGNKNIVESLLANGAKADVPSGEGGVTALHSAAHKGHAKVVEMLLQFDANINVQDDGGNTPLHCAIRRNRIEVVTTLLQNDCDVNIRGKSGNTALGLALENFVDSDSDFSNVYSSDDSCGSDDSYRSDGSYGYAGRGRKYVEDKILKKVSKAVRDHVLKLRAAGFFISKWNEYLIDWAYDDDDKELAQFNRKCEKEVQKLKENKLCSHVSLFSVLANYNNPKFVRNDSAICALESIDQTEFPIYGKLLINRAKVAKRMHDLLGPGTKWLSVLLKTRNFFNQDQVPTLPMELLEGIILSLRTIDVKCLIACGEELKRQVSKC